MALRAEGGEPQGEGINTCGSNFNLDAFLV